MHFYELEFPGDIKKGDNGPAVKRLQEWLCLRGANTAIDGDFGPATESALVSWQKKQRGFAAISKTLTRELWESLTTPMRNSVRLLNANATITGKPYTFGDMMVYYSKQHLAAKAREIGGDNKGPWVRLYCGSDGPKMYWCAGFVSFIMRQAANFGNTPIVGSTSCDVLAAHAIHKELFVPGKTIVKNKVHIPAGSVFLIRSEPGNWTHTGIVTAHTGDVIETIEGNTNDDGSRNGCEVCARHRRVTEKIDFIVWKV